MSVGAFTSASSRRAAPSATVAVAIVACSPEVVSYQALPRRLCPGGSTLLRWSVKGNATLSAEPALPGVGPVRSADSARFRPTEITTFTITAERFGKSAFARQEVSILDSSRLSTIGAMTAALGVESLQTIARLDSTVWDARMQVVEVFGRSGRPLVVRHGGRQALLAGDASGSVALRGTGIVGDWTIHAPLGPGEVIGDSTHAPPDRLHLAVRFTCAP